ncbi:MAG: GNAT family N-acetyltransferase [Chloroflexi bacterium]|nr:GNAT family N-acetyltransferase [Chloroflexota bacterium]
MTILETERLTLRNFCASDWEALHEIICQYQASELAAYDQPWPTSPDEIRKIAAWFASGERYLAVCLKDTGRLIGFVALNPEQGERALNLGYVFNSDYHGQGYATEACQALLSHAFGTLQAEKVVSGTAAANQSSCRLLARLGFRRVGESVTSFGPGRDGKPAEFLGYSFELTRGEWEAAG